MIEPADEMVRAFNRASGLDGDQHGAGSGIRVRDGLAAVLAIIERDYAIGPAMCDAPGHPTEPLAYCELLRGHSGTHSATVEKAVDW